MEALARIVLAEAGRASNPGDALMAIEAGRGALIGLLLPVLAGIFLLSAGSAFWQVGAGWHPEVLAPKLARLSWRTRGFDIGRSATDAGLRCLLALAIFAAGATAIVTGTDAAATPASSTLLESPGRPPLLYPFGCQSFARP